MLKYRLINTEYIILIQFMAAIQSVNPATHDMRSHYSSKDIAGIKARVCPLNLLMPEENVQTI